MKIKRQLSLTSTKHLFIATRALMSVMMLNCPSPSPMDKLLRQESTFVPTPGKY